jgi:histidyl-tRNA synthetase
MKYQIPKGLNDLLPPTTGPKELWQNIELWQALEGRLREAARLFGYSEIRTPIFEKTELFTRSAGDSSDIVFKEMYTFIDKGERSMTLRPEGTACVMRSIIESGCLHESPIQKLYYIGPFFRYDRPQAGRYRQFHHFGIESFGIEGPELDAEVIELLSFIFSSLGIKNVTLLINTIGTAKCRSEYAKELKAYLEPHYETLSIDSQKRLAANPLRILDSKEPQDIAIVAEAPKLTDFLDAPSQAHFARLLHLLDVLGIAYQIEPKLVRGLDYYNHTVFEFVSNSLGAQSTVAAGGRYDGLSEKLGGAHVPSVGFAIGIERLLQTLIAQGIHFRSLEPCDLLIIPMGAIVLERCIELAHTLRKKGIATIVYLKGGKINKALAYSDKINPTYRIVIGEDEIRSSKVILKNLKSKEEKEVSFDNILSSL